jgi:hypothetical protein
MLALLASFADDCKTVRSWLHFAPVQTRSIPSAVVLRCLDNAEPRNLLSVRSVF